MCCFQPLSLWEFVTEAIENQTGAEPAPRWSVFSASVQVSRARSLRQLAWMVTMMGRPRRSPTQPGVVTKYLMWCGGLRALAVPPWSSQPSKPHFALPTLSEQTPRTSPTTPPHTYTFVSSQVLWLQVRETTTGYHKRASLGGYGCLTEQREHVRKLITEKMVPRSRNERAPVARHSSTR